MKHIRRILIGILVLPFALIGLLIWFELFGMFVNHAATGIQTQRALRHLKGELSGVEILDVRSETGNSSGTGNHVDCKTVIRFTADESLAAVQERLDAYYDWDMWVCHVEQDGDAYQFYECKRAPFVDNIEGH